MSITESINKIKENLAEGVELIAVSKTKPEEDIVEAYEGGQRHFGENKVQDLVTKYEHLPKDISWHFIGHLQTNKVKYLASFVHLIHAVDSQKLLKVIQKEALKHDRIISCLLQVKVAQEDSKFGLCKDDLEILLDEKDEYPNIRIAGLMAMATNTDDDQVISTEFKQVKEIYDSVKTDEMDTLSMGMSGDWPVAIECGSTMIRVGSTIFGARNYKQI